MKLELDLTGKFFQGFHCHEFDGDHRFSNLERIFDDRQIKFFLASLSDD